ncbi:hypothetical protein CC1G_00875 [Coprinopsis cinerea okayama7|uniref:Cytochrome c oxidase assembly protein n=1 Tax=Coprinopsis cinerea (strain Okayama-7 / 130 / ATCC MYA-4618 / FGSC 9003) TaxID=240176 RepID=A8N900_COPC7|nr:hypothetical protein CC1G_00875 [Coprinopsis cinerea okayama7\|eukprot:XP_001831328.1 hypothetical protein CC1G_00875 [Coprinopsis cinerea okayama7\
MANLRKAKITLGGAVAFCALTIWAVHYQQEKERDTMYQGVIRDDERRREKLRQRQLELEESQRKRELYERYQKVEKASD